MRHEVGGKRNGENGAVDSYDSIAVAKSATTTPMAAIGALNSSPGTNGSLVLAPQPQRSRAPRKLTLVSRTRT